MEGKRYMNAYAEILLAICSSWLTKTYSADPVLFLWTIPEATMSKYAGLIKTPTTQS